MNLDMDVVITFLITDAVKIMMIIMDMTVVHMTIIIGTGLMIGHMATLTIIESRRVLVEVVESTK